MLKTSPNVIIKEKDVDLSGLDDLIRRLGDLEKKFDDFVKKINIDEIYRRLKDLEEKKADRDEIPDVSDMDKMKKEIRNLKQITDRHTIEIEDLKNRLNSLLNQILNMGKKGSSGTINIDFSNYVLKSDFDIHKKENEAEHEKIWEELRRLQALIDEILKELAKKADKKEKKEKKTSGHKNSDFHIGDKVLVLSLDTEGHIIELADSKGLFLVEMGILTSRFPASDLLIIDEEKLNKKNQAQAYRAAALSSSSTAMTFKPEINLLGKTVDDAINILDKYLDDAYMSHLNNVRVVHGKGAGILRQAVHAHLKSVPYVKSFKLGEFGEGDAGVTIVTFIK